MFSSGGLFWLYSYIMEFYVIIKKVKMFFVYCYERIFYIKVRCLMLYIIVSVKMGKGENINVYVIYICAKYRWENI